MTGNSADDVSAGDHEPARAERAAVAPAVLTFLIADVRGYTSFTHEHGDEEAGRLAAVFAELARATVASAGGELIELRGDEALSVFGSARQAVRAAVELQTAFRRQTDDGPTFPLPIGVGLDAGEAVPIEGGYRGGALNTAARLCSIAGPGETLATDTVVSLARRVEGIRYVPRRPVRLKGLDQPVRVIEVVPEAELPPLPAVAAKKRPPVTKRWLAVAAVAVGALVAALVAFLLARSDGSTALAQVAPNAIAVIDGDSPDVSAQVKLQSAPTAITSGGGAAWVANAAAGTVSRLDLESNAVQTLSLHGRLGGIAYGAGSLWVTNSDGRGLVQINPRTSAVVQTISVGNAPGAVAVGEGAIWVANTVDGTISRVDLASGSASDTIAVGPNPAGIAVARGGVWVAVESTGSVLRIDPTSRAVVQTIHVGNGPTGIAVGGGSVWVANTRDGTVSRVDLATNAVSATLPVGRNPLSVAATRDAVWVANSGEDTVSRIDPQSAEVSDTLTLGSRPGGIALLGRTVYATTAVRLAGHRGGVLKVMSEPSECRCVDPIFALGPNVADFGVADLVYDGLVAYRRVGGSAGAELVPNLAARLPTSSDGGRTYRVQLRGGIRYSDGTLLRASDFRTGIERDLALNAGTVFRGVVGASHCPLARPARPCDLSRGIEADDAKRTLIIRLTSPDANFVYKLALPEAALVPTAKAPRTARAHSMPGTGPYRVASFHPKREVRLVRNANFRVWAADARPNGYPGEIRFKMRPEAAARLRAVETGGADWVSLVDPGVSGEQQQGLLTRYADLLHSDAKPATFWAFLNTRVPPFDDVRVRRALNYAIDRRALVDATGVAATATCQIIPPSFPGYRPYCPYTRNPSPAGTWTAPDVRKARSLVRASGTAGMRVELAGVSGQPEAVRRYIVSVLRQLGYRTSQHLVTGDFVAFIANSRNRVQIASTGWFPDTLAASNFFQLFECSSFVPNSAQNLNLFEYCDRRLDSKIKKAGALQLSDFARANKLSAEVDRALVDEAVALPWANPPNRVLVSDRVGNYQSHPLWGTLLDQLWVR
jgi:YVTN family beta-propeller protein